MSSEQELRDSFEAALSMPDSPAKVAALDRAIRHADASGDEKLAFEFRHESVETFTFFGDGRRAFLAFSQALAAYDRDPSIASAGTDHMILWQFKWIVNGLPDFPEVPLDRTYAVLADMQSRYLRGGHSMHAVHQARWNIAMHVGDLDQAERSYRDMLTSKRDSLSNCAVCVPSAQVWYLVEHGRHEEAVAVGRPVEQRWCRTQPQRVQTRLMLPYLLTGQHRKAVELQRMSYRKLRAEALYLSEIGAHLTFLGRTGNEARALELLERHLPWLDAGSSAPGDVLEFAAPAVLVLRRLSEQGHGDLAVSGRSGPDGRRADSTVDELLAELTEFTLALAARFDARNGTSYRTEVAQRRMSAEPVVDQLPIGVLETVKGKARGQVRALQERVAAFTAAGDHQAAALARLDAALALRSHGKAETRYGAAEEAALALERAGLVEELRTARTLLWELYRDGGERDPALAALDLLLADDLSPVRKAELLTESTRLLWGAERAVRWIEVADLWRGVSAPLAELSALCGAIEMGQQVDALTVGGWLARADTLAGSAGPLSQAGSLSPAASVGSDLAGGVAEAADRSDAARSSDTAGDVASGGDVAGGAAGDSGWPGVLARLQLAGAFWLLSAGRPAEALGRAEAAFDSGQADTSPAAACLIPRLLLALEQPVAAEQRARQLLAVTPTEVARQLHVLVARSMRAQQRDAEVADYRAAHDLADWEIDDDDDYDEDDYDDED